MLKKLLATGIVFAAGYLVGVIFGFRAAVVDYVEDDAELIEEQAADIYPSRDEESLPEEVREALDRDKHNSSSNEQDGKGFQ